MTYQVRRKYKIFISNIPATTFFISTKNITIQSIISKTTLCIQRDKKLDSRAHGAFKFSSCFSNKGNMKGESKCFSEETWQIFPGNPLKRPFPHSCEQRHWLKLCLTKYSDLKVIVQPSLDLVTLCLLTEKECCKGLFLISKIQLVVYYQRCVLIGWATTRLYVTAH